MSPSLIPLLLRADSTMLKSLLHVRGLLAIVAASLSSHWHHVNDHSSVFVICFIMVSPVLKVFVTVVSVFYKEHVIQCQNALFFLLSHLPLLLVLFKGILKCCRLCAITQSYRFSVTKALYQRMWNQGKDIFFLLQIKGNYFVSRLPKRPTQRAVKTKQNLYS